MQLLQLLKQKKGRLNRRGFTLVELIVVIVILAVLAGIAIPAVSSYLESANQGRVLANGRSAYSAASVKGADKIVESGGKLLATSTDITHSEVQAMSKVPGTISGTYNKDGSVSTFKYEENGYEVTLDGGTTTELKVAKKP